jgi:beta-N-acetylhexosaminidase
MRGRRTATLGSLLLATAIAVAAAPAAGATVPSGDAATAADARVDAVLARMTPAEKVGQMFVDDVYGQSATSTDPADVAANRKLYGADVDNGAEAVAKYHLGGVIYFAWSDNLASPPQIAGLSDGLQQAAAGSGSGVPVQISTDQEGGVVNRIGAPLAVSPGNMAIGATGVPADARAAARVTGEQLRALGINTDDAPVSDVNTNPRNAADGPRSFGDRPATVARYAADAVRGFADAGIGAQAKHFPGLGDTTVNTDSGVAVSNETRAQFLARDIPPFRAAIDAGVPAVMAAHIVAPRLDPSGAPASLSEPMVSGLLRGTLHYHGVVITDALDAGALAGLTEQQIVLGAVEAGDDQLLMPTNLPQAEQILLDAVRDGTVSRSRIDQSVRRILLMKQHLGLLGGGAPVPGTGTVGTPAQLATMAGIARRSTTLLRNGAGVLPLSAGSHPHVLVTGWGAGTTRNLSDALGRRGLLSTPLWTGSPDQTTIDQAVAAAKQNDVTVVTTYNAWNDATQQSLVKQLLATGKPVVVASVGGPYDLSAFPSAPTYLTAYGYQQVSTDALADVLLGGQPTGRLPVTVPTADGSSVLLPYGSGLGYY